MLSVTRELWFGWYLMFGPHLSCSSVQESLSLTPFHYPGSSVHYLESPFSLPAIMSLLISPLPPTHTFPLFPVPVLLCSIPFDPVQSYPVQPRPISSCPVMSYSVFFCPILFCSLLSCPVLSYTVLLILNLK